MIQRTDNAFAALIQNMHKSSLLQHHYVPATPALSGYHIQLAKYAWQSCGAGGLGYSHRHYRFLGIAHLFFIDMVTTFNPASWINRIFPSGKHILPTPFPDSIGIFNSQGIRQPYIRLTCLNIFIVPFTAHCKLTAYHLQ